MSAEAINARIRVRPLRFGFVIKPDDRAALMRVMEINTCLWGGIFNFIIPLFHRTPQRYRDRPLPGPTAKELVGGLIEAFEPDFLVEAQPGLASDLSFPEKRIIGIDDLFRRDERGRGGYGLTLIDVCAALYEDAFRFVQRHPPKVIVPLPAERGHDLLMAATFGAFPKKEPLSDFRRHFAEALGAADEKVTRQSFNGLFEPNIWFPLRVGAHMLGRQPDRRWTPDPKLFYMDESSPIDIIEFWNFRALGWRVKPLPRSWAAGLKDECERFLRESYRPYPPPSNAAQHGGFLCSKSCLFEGLRQFVGTLKRETPDPGITIDHRFPRLWDEWGRNADHATRREVGCASQTVAASDYGEHVSVTTVLPEFVEESADLPDYACVNVIESLPGAAAVMPLRIPEFQETLLEFDASTVWPGREGIIAVRGLYNQTRIWKKPSPMAVFSAWLSRYGLKADLSSSGRIAGQVIQALGGLRGTRMLANEDLLRLLNRMAHGEVEIEIDPDDPKRRRSVRAYAVPRPQMLEILSRSCGSSEIGNNLLASLVHFKILVVGLRLQCPECRQTNWYRLADLDASLRCERCLQTFDFPAAEPPRDVWAYRANGPFAIENYAQGAYCVALALHFIEEQLADGSSWIPNVSLKDGTGNELEADFAMFLRPRVFSHISEPFVIFGECKMFDQFKPRDISRMEQLGDRFPGAVLCFATLNQELTPKEKEWISRLARKGRQSLRTGQQMNPVLVLTRAELLPQRGGARQIAQRLPKRFRAYVPNMLFRGDIQEICDFTLQAHLDMESIHDWWKQKSEQKRRKAAQSQATRISENAGRV
ncbi:MAG: hypothetical protein AAB225_07530 [Acidobacteriota bacterium]